MANVLVTGGAGFIGSHIVSALVEEGHRLHILDDLSSGFESNLAHLGDRFDLIKGDMCDLATCQEACKGIEFVFHEAAIASVPKSIDHPDASHNANVNGTYNMLRACVDNKVHRFIYAASSSAYGNLEVSPKHEGLMPQPLSPYAVQKYMGECYARSFYECYGLETISLRYFNVFGSRQDPQSDYAAAIPAFVMAILRGQQPTIYGDGEQTRDFSHIDNVVAANLLAMKVEKTQGQVVNIACGGAISINEVIATINKVVGANITPIHTDPRAGDVLHSCADITLAKKLLDYSPIIDFEHGLHRAIEYYKSLLD